MNARVLIAAFAGAIAYFLLGWLVYGILTPDFYATHSLTQYYNGLEKIMSIKITFPDGAVKEFNEGITALEIAGQLSNSLPKKVLAAEINGEVQDATRAINTDATIKLLTWNDTNGKSTFWHSSAHLFAEAMEALIQRRKIWYWTTN
jgi:hypothetical protein